jgi:hypothetical protein
MAGHAESLGMRRSKVAEQMREPIERESPTLDAQVLDFMTRARLGLLGLATAADVISAYCRHNYWIATGVKYKTASTEVKKEPAWSDKQWERYLQEGEANIERCRAAMAAFLAGGSEEGLRRELTAVTDFFNNRSPPA